MLASALPHLPEKNISLAESTNRADLALTATASSIATAAAINTTKFMTSLIKNT